MADEIEAGNLRALLVAGGNIALNLPNHRRLAAALRRLEVLVVADVVTTETTAKARLTCGPAPANSNVPIVTMIHDVLMPAVMCQYTPAVLPSSADRRPMWWAFAQLGRRIGFDVLPDLDLDTATDDDVLAIALQQARLGLEELRAAGGSGATGRDRPRCSGGCTNVLPRRSLAAGATRARAAARGAAPACTVGVDPAASTATSEHAASPAG